MSIASILGRITDIAGSVGDAYGAYQGFIGVSQADRERFGIGRSSLPAVPGGFSTGGSLSRYVPPAAAPYVTGSRQSPLVGGCPMPGYHYAKDGSGRLVKNRRMNVLNAKAARRAIRRIKGARKMLNSIERSLPTRKVASRAPAVRRR